MGKVVPREQIKKYLASQRDGRRVVFTNGCFDLLHVGHVRYLQDARALGDMLVVGLNADASVRELKGPTRPVQPEGDRAEILAALACVDVVVVFTEQTPLNLIKDVMPQLLVKGGDWAVDKIVGSDVVLASGGEVRSLPFHPGRSSSSIMAKIQSL